MTAIVAYAGATDIGLGRSENQDQWFADPKQGLFIVADGMGGHHGGRLAAEIVVEVLPRLVRQRIHDEVNGTAEDARRQLLDALADLSERLWYESQARVGVRGLGSTVVVALIRGHQAIIAHLGDSRAYLLRQDDLRLLTHDHCLAQALIDTTSPGADEGAQHSARAHLTRYVGMQPKARPESQAVELSTGDRLLLCSDGLFGMMTDGQLQKVLGTRVCLSEVCHELIAAAKAGGGQDNMTAVVLEIGRRER